ncbi:tetratricopeptide repeat protein [Actinomadura luteofluorescens]
MPSGDALPKDHEHIVTATWELSIDQADRAEPLGLARPVLQMASVLDPAGIPQAALSSPPALDYLTGYRPDAPAHTAHQDSQVSGEMVDEALRLLHRHSLIDHDRTATHREIRVHHLVQRATRENLRSGTRNGSARFTQLAHAAANAVAAIWPKIERDHLGQILRANTTTLQDAVSIGCLISPATGAHSVLFQAATSLGETGQVEAAVTAYASLVVAAQDHLNTDHPDILKARHGLARWQGEMGDSARAVAAFEEVLDDQTRILGSHHLQTLTTLHSLAYWQGKTGNVTGAVEAFQEVWEKRKRVLGPHHVGTLEARHNLAYWKGEAGDIIGAIAMHEEVLEDRSRILGPEHLQTLSTRHNLALWRGVSDAHYVVSALREMLVDFRRVLGPEHPFTLIARGNLAQYLGEAGNADAAAVAFRKLVADRTRVLGPDHPQTQAAHQQMVHWQEVQRAATSNRDIADRSNHQEGWFGGGGAGSG